MEPGICYIKKEFLIQEPNYSASNGGDSQSEDNKRKLMDIEKNGNNDESGEGNKEVSPEKYQKTNKKERKRGQFKNRPVYKEDRSLHLCYSLINGPGGAACPLPNCRYVHNLEEFLASKPEDLGDECPIFLAKGFCSRGVTCRFAKSHLDAEGRNIKAPDFDENKPSSTVNGISTELQVRLRKREYDFSRCKTFVQHFEKLRDAERSLKKSPTVDNDAAKEEPQVEDAIEKPVGAVVDEESASTARDACNKRKIDFSEKLLLSPLTTVGNLPFRRICKEFGADITCGEMACAVPLVKGLLQEWALTKRHESEDIFGVQLCGNNAQIIAQAAQLMQEQVQVDFLDLNIGCPIELIYQQGGGSALMRRTNVLESTVRSCVALAPEMPFTVKMRTGVYADKSVAHNLLPSVEEWGAAAVTIHGRSREQRYTKSARWDYIEKCASRAKSIPVIGNGDILTFQDYNERRKEAPHVSSVMIGRGALIKPWIFKEIKEQKHWDPSSTERFDLMKKYVNYGLEHWGSDTKGVETTRRFLLEWQSFLYRYIPFDLIEFPPQKINQRPQKFRGRDEMETLMASPNATDWVKLSEMLLGPVPEGFTFVPKHKANAY